jgi:RNA polymerase sigma-70 factor (ECF subfamily)
LSAPQSKTEIPSFDVVYEQYFEFVWSMTRRFGVPRALIDDVVQEVFMVVHGKLQTLRQPESLRSWLYGIVRRTAFHQRRQFGDLTVQEGDLPGPSEERTAQSPADIAEQNARVLRLWTLLSQLDPTKREVFIMAELEEFTCPEIAEALNIPLNTAYSRLRTAREDFDAALAREAARNRGRA